MSAMNCNSDRTDVNCFDAQIEQHDYFGEFREYKVRLTQTEICLNVVTSPTSRHQVGDRPVIYDSARTLSDCTAHGQSHSRSQISCLYLRVTLKQ
jgi:hypothetical protein